MQMLCIFFFCECVFYERILNFRSLIFCVSVYGDSVCINDLSVWVMERKENSEMTVYVVHTVLRIYVLCQQAVMRQRNYWNEWDQNVNKEEQLDDDVVVGKSTWRKCVYNVEILSMIISLTGKSHKDANQTQISKAHTHFRMFASQANTIFPLQAQTTNRNSDNNNK